MAKIELSGNSSQSVFARRRLRSLLLDGVQVTSSIQVVEPNREYIADNPSLIDFQLPEDFPAWSSFTIVNGMASGPFKISQKSGQQIAVDGVTTTEGPSGSVSTSDASAAISISCIGAGKFMTSGPPQGLFSIQ